MANEFKTIETQEELDAIIKARLDRNTKTVTDEVKKSYEGSCFLGFVEFYS